MADNKQATIAHAIMIALPYQGHISPFVNLAIKLASNGFSITFVHLEFIHHKMIMSQSEPDFFSHARKSGFDIRYATISDGFPLEFDRALHSDHYWDTMLRDFPARVEDFVGKMIDSDPCSAHFLIADTMYTWPATVARKYNLVNVSFWTEPALIFSLSHHLDLLRQNGHFPCKDNLEEEIKYIPGIKSISTRDLISYFKESETATTEHKVVQKAFEEVKKADFILHNTVIELESDTVAALNKIQPNYAVGPVNFFQNSSQSLRSESDCTKWLDSKRPGSVLYISFGSLVQTSKQVIEEIAHGLVLSGVNFIWVVRTDIVGSSKASSDVLPLGFLDKIKDNGLIVPWCDQTAVLANPATGGFLTHCGWNSTLESMWYGIPMICYPITYDQPTNRKLVVEDWKIGISLCQGQRVEREEVAHKIRCLMSGNDELSQEAKKVKAILRSAVEANGSSDRNFVQFVKDLKSKIYASKEDI